MLTSRRATIIWDTPYDQPGQMPGTINVSPPLWAVHLKPSVFQDVNVHTSPDEEHGFKVDRLDVFFQRRSASQGQVVVIGVGEPPAVDDQGVLRTASLIGSGRVCTAIPSPDEAPADVADLFYGGLSQLPARHGRRGPNLIRSFPTRLWFGESAQRRPDARVSQVRASHEAVHACNFSLSPLSTGERWEELEWRMVRNAHQTARVVSAETGTTIYLPTRDRPHQPVACHSKVGGGRFVSTDRTTTIRAWATGGEPEVLNPLSLDIRFRAGDPPSKVVVDVGEVWCER